MHKELEWFENVFRFLFLISCCTKGCLHKKRSYYFKWPPTLPHAPHRSTTSHFVFKPPQMSDFFSIYVQYFQEKSLIYDILKTIWNWSSPSPPLVSRRQNMSVFFQILYLRGEPVFRWTAYKRFFFWDQKFQKGEPHTSQKWGVMSFLNGSASARNRVMILAF